MTRIIKYRAWDKKKEQFVYFELFEWVNNYTPPIYQEAQLEKWEKSTWLLDSNGIEVYFWDILECKESWNRVEVYFVQHWYTIVPSVQSWWYREWEIIWNIYKNPELLK